MRDPDPPRPDQYRRPLPFARATGRFEFFLVLFVMVGYLVVAVIERDWFWPLG